MAASLLKEQAQGYRSTFLGSCNQECRFIYLRVMGSVSILGCLLVALLLAGCVAAVMSCEAPL